MMWLNWKPGSYYGAPPGVRIADRVRVHSTAVFDAGATEIVLWDGVEIGPFCYIVGAVQIGRGTKIGAHVVIGTDGEHRSARADVGPIVIGEDVVIREFSAVQRGTGDRDTSIGNRAMLMDHSHIAHDVVIDEDVTLSPNVVLGGHTRVHRGATVGIGAMTHQHSTIGAYAMIGMGSVVTKDVPPFALVMGNPARYVRENVPKGALAIARGPNTDAFRESLRLKFSQDSRRTVLPKI